MSTSTENQTLLHGPLRTRMGRTMVLDMTAPQTNLVVERGSTLARGSVIVTTCARRLQELSKAGEKVKAIVVVGSDSDPVDHPDLRDITENLRALRDKWFNRAKLAIITSATNLEGWGLRSTLGMYDSLLYRFECGTAKTYAAVTGEKATELAKITRQLQNFDHLVVQTSFFRGPLDNSTEIEVGNWIKKLQEMGPREVHILTGPGERPKKVKAITPKRRQQIADKAAEVLGVNVTIHEDDPLLV
jgi:hypothetical protein